MNAHSYRTVGRVIGALFVRGHDRSERVNWALTARGFAGEIPTLTPSHFQWTDGLAGVLVVCFAVGLFLLDRAW
jgi:cobalt/nickel transport system permease protein